MRTFANAGTVEVQTGRLSIYALNSTATHSGSFTVATNAILDFQYGGQVITGTLNSTPNTTFVVEFFSNPAGTGDPSGFGEGRTFLGRTSAAH